MLVPSRKHRDRDLSPLPTTPQRDKVPVHPDLLNYDYCFEKRKAEGVSIVSRCHDTTPTQ